MKPGPAITYLYYHLCASWKDCFHNFCVFFLFLIFFTKLTLWLTLTPTKIHLLTLTQTRKYILLLTPKPSFYFDHRRSTNSNQAYLEKQKSRKKLLNGTAWIILKTKMGKKDFRDKNKSSIFDEVAFKTKKQENSVKVTCKTISDFYTYSFN